MRNISRESFGYIVVGGHDKMNTNPNHKSHWKNQPFKFALYGAIISTVVVVLALSEHYGWKQRGIIKRDFQEIYPDYNAHEYQFDIGETQTQVTINYLDENDNECSIQWEYVKWDKLGWINIDSSDAIIININEIIDKEQGNNDR